MHNTGQILIQY